MLRELKSLSKQLNWIGLTVKANHIDLMIRSIAGDIYVAAEIELAISELIRTMGSKNAGEIHNEIAELLMLHGNYTKFLGSHTVEGSEDNFYIKGSDGSIVIESTETPEKAVALLLTKQGDLQDTY